MNKSMEPLLEIKKLNAGYGKSHIIFDVDLVVYAKEIVTLIGPNGAGKSTIIRSIFNLTTIHSGRISFLGKGLSGKKTFSLIKEKIVYLNQGRVVFTNLSVEENLDLAGELIFSAAEVKRKKEEIFQLYPVLQEKRNQRAKDLSGGQQQQLALSRSLIQDPKLLLLDEPTLGLSPVLQKELFLNLKQLRDRGISFLMVEQNARSAIELADRTYLLENGKVKLEGDKKILDNPMIKKVYLGGE